MKRIGIYAGTFDPIHSGHISFALAALKASSLSEIYFVPERSPRHKPDVSSYEMRVHAMEQTMQRQSHLELLELPDTCLTVRDTLPELMRSFPNTQLVFLMGADVVQHMHTWPEIQRLVADYEFIIGMREGYEDSTIRAAMRALNIPDAGFKLVRTDQSHISSSAIRKPT